MEVWKEKPEWFDLKNYELLSEFSARDWYLEILTRIIFVSDRGRCHYLDKLNSSEERKKADKTVELIKSEGLTRKVSTDLYQTKSQYDADYFFKPLLGTYEPQSSVVRKMSEQTAYGFYFESDNRKEIEKDFIRRGNPKDSDWFSKRCDAEVNQWHKEFVRKYSFPISDSYSYPNTAFLEIDLSASDHTIVNEFNVWLKREREIQQLHIKREFTQKTFNTWCESMALPYWDLVNIARIEGATIPNHVLGNILFPDTYDVDVSERIRKVTKVKSDYVFTWEVVNALNRQYETEEN